MLNQLKELAELSNKIDENFDIIFLEIIQKFLFFRSLFF